jgi:hypothetical protein
LLALFWLKVAELKAHGIDEPDDARRGPILE